MFHLQLRQFPHNHCQFNLTDQELRFVAETWVRGLTLALGERTWSPHQAKLTIIEGPQIPMQQLSMGRGWRHAERQGENVTRSVLEAASASLAGAAAAPTSAAPDAVAESEPSANRDALGAARLPSEAPGSAASALPSLLGGGARAEALLAAWRDTARRFPDRSPSECLALAEQQLQPHSGGPDR